ncbi:hypothetical protein [uncultured Thiodictyon sp.]|uniref:hypothetical protein n=1 Tax=uncultured Thiodictyon sp. TaxID=1846217 RepID=UPI0025D2DF53|nr:hypothetical protein [uncultured Thiodictyon sp.]
MNRLFAAFALLGLVASLAVHLAALLGIDLATRFPAVWLLFIPFLFQARRVLGVRPSRAAIRALCPGWALLLGVFLAGYVMLNFLLFLHATEGGGPAIRDGRYVLQAHGPVLRTLTADEYRAQQANTLRGFSGHWLIFYYVPLVWFMACGRSGAASRTVLP